MNTASSLSGSRKYALTYQRSPSYRGRNTWIPRPEHMDRGRLVPVVRRALVLVASSPSKHRDHNLLLDLPESQEVLLLPDFQSLMLVRSSLKRSSQTAAGIPESHGRTYYFCGTTTRAEGIATPRRVVYFEAGFVEPPLAGLLEERLSFRVARRGGSGRSAGRFGEVSYRACPCAHATQSPAASYAVSRPGRRSFRNSPTGTQGTPRFSSRSRPRYSRSVRHSG